MFRKFLHKFTGERPNWRVVRYPKERGYIYSVSAFRDILRRECARADRNGHTFSLAVLRLPVGDKSKTAQSEAIVDLVGDRLRVTDQAGWREPDRVLAILLYACTTDDARHFVERVRRDGSISQLEYDIYAYPDQFPPELTEGLCGGIPCQKQ